MRLTPTLVMLMAAGRVVSGASHGNAPPLPLAGARIVKIATEPQLQTAVDNLATGDTILLGNGRSYLTRSLYINRRNNVALYGSSGSTNVVLVGANMDDSVATNAAARVTSAHPARIILLRHAEKPLDKRDLHLSARGRQRAEALVPLLTATPAFVVRGPPVALFATRPSRHDHSRRPYETLEPLARNLGLRIQTPYPTSGYVALARSILVNPAYDGKTVVVCWVHTHLPELAKAFGVKAKVPPWPGSVYDRVWVITCHRRTASLSNLPQSLLPGDSAR